MPYDKQGKETPDSSGTTEEQHEEITNGSKRLRTDGSGHAQNVLAQLRAAQEDEDLDADLAARLSERADELEGEVAAEPAVEPACCMHCGDEHAVDAMAVYEDRDAAGVAAKVRLCDRCGEQPRYTPVATDTDRRRIMTDGGQVTACRNCDSTDLWQRDPTSAHSPFGPDDPKYRCLDCGAEFDTAVRRDPIAPGRKASSNANALLDADPDDIVTDGGEPVDGPVFYLLELGCDACRRVSKVVVEYDTPLPVDRDVSHEYEHCPYCGEVARWHLFEETRVEKVPPVDELDRGEGIATDGGEVEACPNCDSAEIHRRTTGSMHAPHAVSDDAYRCRDCSTTFDTPARRERQGTGHVSSAHGQALIDADPDDIATDGGEEMSPAEAADHFNEALDFTTQSVDDWLTFLTEHDDLRLVAQDAEGTHTFEYDADDDQVVFYAHGSAGYDADGTRAALAVVAGQDAGLALHPRTVSDTPLATDGGVEPFTDDLELQPHPWELGRAINGDHVVRFSFHDDRDTNVTVCVWGEPTDGDEWPHEIDGELNWTTLEIRGETATQLAGRAGEVKHEVVIEGARVFVSAHVGRSKDSEPARDAPLLDEPTVFPDGGLVDASPEGTCDRCGTTTDRTLLDGTFRCESCQRQVAEQSRNATRDASQHALESYTDDEQDDLTDVPGAWPSACDRGVVSETVRGPDEVVER